MPKVALLLGLVCASLAVAQNSSNSITVTASQNANLTPDQAIFSISVQSDTNTSLNDVLTALQGSGLTAANFSGVNTPEVFNPGTGATANMYIDWNFTLDAPLTSTTATVAALATLQQKLTQNSPPLSLSFTVQGTQISAQQQQSQTCSISGLLANAQSQAQTLANAGGLNLNSILSISGSTPSSGSCALTVTYSVASVPLGLLAPDTIAITSTQQVTLQPDQALFYVYVVASQTKGLNDVLGAVESLGITAANFNSLYTSSDGSIQWSFNLAVPLANTQTTVASLIALQNSIANGFTLSFDSGGLQDSPALLASQTCPVASLVSAAQAQAQTIANAAGLSVGPILSLNTSGTGTGATYFAVSGFLTASGFLNELLVAPSNCSVVATFRLLR